jgi:heme exporter protein C
MMRQLINLFNRLLAGPTFFRFGDALIPWLTAGAVLASVAGIAWGLIWAPAHYEQGESFRMIYVHVPAAWLSLSGYAFMAGAAVFALVWRARLAEVMVWAAAPVGAVFTALALLTGSLWGRPMWGTWWAWDARLTSELILLFLYLGVMALYNAFADTRQGARAASLLAVVGVVNLPIIHYSVVWWNSLHQGASISFVRAESSMDPSMLWPLLVTTIGAQCAFAVIVLLRARAGLLERDRRKRWAAELVKQKPGLENTKGKGLMATAAAIMLAWLAVMLSLPSDESPFNYRTPLQVARQNVAPDQATTTAGWLQLSQEGKPQLRGHDPRIMVTLSDPQGLLDAGMIDEPLLLSGTLAVDGRLQAQRVSKLSPLMMWLSMEGYGYFLWTCFALYGAGLLGIAGLSRKRQGSAARRVLRATGA